MNDAKPLLTVLMTVRNGMPFLKEAVQSILNQTYDDFVFLIIDNASDDGTGDYLNSLNDSRIKTLFYEEIGIVESLNFGTAKIDTKYTAVMDADDISHPKRLERELSFLERMPNIGLVGTSVEYFLNTDGRKWKVKLPAENSSIVQALLKNKYVISHPTVMFRTDLMKKIGGYQKSAYPVPDLDMFLRMHRVTEFANLSDIFCRYRVHNKSYTSENLIGIAVNSRKLVKEFIGGKKQKPYVTRLGDYLSYLSLLFYKKGLYKYLDNSKIIWLLFISVSGFMNPSKAFFHLLKKMIVK